MTSRALLANLANAGVEVKPTGTGNLEVRGPQEALTSEVLARVKKWKGELLALLEEPIASEPPLKPFMAEVESWSAEVQELWAERAAIMEYDGGLSRAEAEHIAYVRIKMGYSGPLPPVEVRQPSSPAAPEVAPRD